MADVRNSNTSQCSKCRIILGFLVVFLGVGFVFLQRSPVASKKLLTPVKSFLQSSLCDKPVVSNKKPDSFASLIATARRAKPEVLYSSNENKTNLVANAAQSVLEQDFASCEKDIAGKFDPYRTCFRDISVEFHNQLVIRIPSHWFTVVGQVQRTFLVTGIRSNRDEYLFRIGELYFQVLEYAELLTQSITEDDN